MAIQPPDIKAGFTKEYIIKMDSGETISITPAELNHFQEGGSGKLAWKWLELPVKPAQNQLNKLVFVNRSGKDLNFSILVAYQAETESDIPFVYYSSTRNAIVTYDDIYYRLFGGVGSAGTGNQFSTVQVETSDWLRGKPFNMQPLSKQSSGWGTEYCFSMKKDSSGYLYEWSFSGEDLQEIEEVHLQYQCLLRRREVPV
ncbi:hypothetical protein MM300_16095 [Evansella sp. LMS18]|jgi:hypothetical protein|uniref:hypothetical protein n=1 Tax=Evansella sp. LMS18 TaxID=2924033 RepID=UPI0020D1BF08|nr:hypothetical protein [Evansella sp. LMS18]UTR09405.1 hypothetical protein MM300_16095 [Evansella sp. LMS18]